MAALPWAASGEGSAGVEEDVRGRVCAGILSGSFALVASAALVPLAALLGRARGRGRGWRWGLGSAREAPTHEALLRSGRASAGKTAYLGLISLHSGLRAAAFGLAHEVDAWVTSDNVGQRVVASMAHDLPGLAFVSAHTLLLVFWAQARRPRAEWGRVRDLEGPPTAWEVWAACNYAVYALQLTCWIVEVIVEAPERSGWAVPSEERTSQVLFAGMCLVAGASFFAGGWKTWKWLEEAREEAREEKQREVASLAGVLGTALVVRSGWLVARNWASAEARAGTGKGAIDWQRVSPLAEVAYYVLVEILPTTLVLYVLTVNPSLLRLVDPPLHRGDREDGEEDGGGESGDEGGDAAGRRSWRVLAEEDVVDFSEDYEALAGGSESELETDPNEDSVDGEARCAPRGDTSEDSG